MIFENSSERSRAEPAPASDLVGRSSDAARRAGHAAGYCQGYVAGWRWGVVCGVCAMGCFVAIAWMAM
jgi:hypothetical protein